MDEQLERREPDMIECADHTWLAVAPATSPYRLGAHGQTWLEAKANFRHAVARLADALGRVSS